MIEKILKRDGTHKEFLAFKIKVLCNDTADANVKEAEEYMRILEEIERLVGRV